MLTEGVAHWVFYIEGVEGHLVGGVGTGGRGQFLVLVAFAAASKLSVDEAQLAHLLRVYCIACQG